MKDRRWSVIRCTGPEGELVWSVVHRQTPMFVAVVSDLSVDHLDEVPPGAIHWAKQASATGDGALLREALETIRSCRSGEQASVGEAPPQRHYSRASRLGFVRRRGR